MRQKLSVPTLKNSKGKLNGSCNRSACQKPGAEWYHMDTKKYYCKSCADMLNNDPFNKEDALRIYGGPLLIPHHMLTLASVS